LYFRDTGKCGGTVLPVDPCEGESEWACHSCGGVVYVPEVIDLVTSASTRLGEWACHSCGGVVHVPEVIDLVTSASTRLGEWACHSCGGVVHVPEVIDLVTSASTRLGEWACHSCGGVVQVPDCIQPMIIFLFRKCQRCRRYYLPFRKICRRIFDKVSSCIKIFYLLTSLFFCIWFCVYVTCLFPGFIHHITSTFRENPSVKIFFEI
jgi:hypothetical protein